jgi:hypothetical protein
MLLFVITVVIVGLSVYSYITIGCLTLNRGLYEIISVSIKEHIS